MLKKVVTTCLLLGCLALPAQAFAIAGFGDTESTAFVRPAGIQTMSTVYASSATDEDWFYYTNASGVNQYVSASVDSSMWDYQFRLDFKVIYSGGYTTSLVRATEAGMVEYAYNILVPPGGTIKYRVMPEQYNPNATYSFTTYQNQ